jgi:hypothetical protein
MGNKKSKNYDEETADAEIEGRGFEVKATISKVLTKKNLFSH